MTFDNHDNPINSKEDDLLGFESLAQRIASSIIGSNIDTKNSFTISIEGKWGSGKTSLVNLISNKIENQVVIVRFNPWLVNDFEQLIEYFFSELLKEIIHESFDAKLKEDIWKDVKNFMVFFTPDKISIGVGDNKVTYNTKETLFNKEEKTLVKSKETINDYLGKLDKRIVIIVDDIDRLTDKETETFFRLIKGIADFDNLIYLLLYDKAIVAKSLEQFKQENGEKYLDKMVQYSIAIPKNYDSVLNKILFEKLDKIKIDNINQDKWNMLVPTLAKYITNIRDINRVINVISFEYPQIATEVDFTDFFIISLIKVQNYELYEFIRDKKHVFKSFNTNKLLAHSNDDEKKKLEDEKKTFDTEIRNFIAGYSDLFYMLFPALKDEEYYKWNRISIHKNKPLDNKHYFDNYFTFSVSDNKIFTQEYTTLSKKLFLIDFKEFEEAILSINSIDKVFLFLDMFRSIEQKKMTQDIENSANVILNLLTIHQKLPKSNSWFNSPSISYFNFSKDIFEKIDKSEDILESIYLKENSISLETKISFYREIKKKYNFETKFSEKIIDEIEKTLRKNIEVIKLDDLVNEKRGLNTITSIYTLISEYKLLDISDEYLLDELNKRIFNSRDDFFNILTLFKSERSVNGGKTFTEISSADMKDYTTLNIEKIEEYISTLDKETFSVKEQEIFKAWNIGNEY